MLRLASALVAAVAFLIWLFTASNHPALDGTLVPEKVLAHGLAITSRSWEYGTLVEAMLELRDPRLTVFGSAPFLRGLIPKVTNPSKVAGLEYAKSVIWTNSTDQLVDGEGKHNAS